MGVASRQPLGHPRGPMHRTALSLALLLTSGSFAAGCDEPREAPDDAATPEGLDAPLPRDVDAGAFDAGAPADATAPLDASSEQRLAGGVTLEGLALFQGVRVELARAGTPTSTRNAPIVAGRDAVVRAYVSATSYPRTLRGELEVREGDRVVSVHSATATLSAASSDAQPTSVLAFEVPAAALTETASIAVRLIDPAGEAPIGAHAARLPRDGSALGLRALDDGAGLHLVLVPFRWDRGGAMRLPDTSEAWLARVRALLTSLYPLVDVRIEVHAPVPWPGNLTWSGSVDFGDINAELMDLRMADRAPEGAYYYGLVAPADDFASYCGRSCVTGQSYVATEAADGDYRVGSGVGFGTESSAWTLAHELGHEHGRYHAPCDTSGSDRDFPYSGGEIGVWGYDARSGTFHPPSGTYDFMGYCDPQWISDYTWSAIFERTRAVSALRRPATARSLLARVEGSRGVLVGTRPLAAPHSTTLTPYSFLDAQGRVLAGGAAPSLLQSHSEERLVVMPAPPSGARAVRVGGVTLPLDD